MRALAGELARGLPTTLDWRLSIVNHFDFLACDRLLLGIGLGEAGEQARPGQRDHTSALGGSAGKLPPTSSSDIPRVSHLSRAARLADSLDGRDQPQSCLLSGSPRVALERALFGPLLARNAHKAPHLGQLGARCTGRKCASSANDACKWTRARPC